MFLHQEANLFSGCANVIVEMKLLFLVAIYNLEDKLAVGATV